MKRVFLIVLDSLGIGKMPDAEKFGDKNPNTLKRISQSKKLSIPNLTKLGIGCIDGVDYISQNVAPVGSYGRLKERSAGKDTTTGHWEIAGIISQKAMPTYPNGFPKEIIDEFEYKANVKTLCNKPYSGTDVINDFGKEHLKSGKLIVYTSADSVFQIAAHEEIVPPEKLYEYCKIARNILVGEHAVGRVIARPFIGQEGNFVRTSNRHDFSLKPTERTMLDAIKSSGKTVYAIGKINDIFAGVGITEKDFTHSNNEGMELCLKALNKDFEGLCFVNLVDFDMLYGHRQNVDGYAQALSEFDLWLSNFTDNMKADDILIITADHGCDPGDEHTDHTREYVPLLVYGNSVGTVDLNTRDSFADIAATVCEYLNVDFKTEGKSFLKAVIK
jgi:phosphopentomutase